MRWFVLRTLTLLGLTLPAAVLESGELRGRIVDQTGRPLAARLYLQDAEGEWLTVGTADAEGSAIPYSKQRSPTVVEIHTSLSAHPFQVELPPGRYTLTVERGKEYFPLTKVVDVGQRPLDQELRLKRWSDMAKEGWFSGETHVHRSLAELPTAMLAEDLNVAFPLTYWVTNSHQAPSQGGDGSAVAPELIAVDPTHVIYPLNTEYELFSVRGQRHTLGAVFALNHKSVFTRGVPPVRPIAEQVHREGGLLELDKHNWPWSMMLIPIMNVDLYELTNNHLWRTEFLYRDWGAKPATYMNVEQDEDGMTEGGWIDFTFQNYYALLNCGFHLRPTAGTASGVHPVPLGFGRVYVYLGQSFSYDSWLEGLDRGRSFVTTGPLLDVRLDGHLPGDPITRAADGQHHLQGWIRSDSPIRRIELVEAGEVVSSISPENRRLPVGAFETKIDQRFTLRQPGSTWLAIRCYQRTSAGRIRFAHTAPFHISLAGRPLQPRAAEVAYLIERVRSEISRNADLLSDEELAEYHESLAVYERLAEQVRD